MYHEPAVGMVHGPGHLGHETDPVADDERVGVGPGRDRCAVDELSDEVGHAVARLAAVDEAGDAGVIEGGEEVALAPEPGGHVGPGERERLANHLEGNRLVEGTVGTVGAVHPPHPPLPDQGVDAIGSNADALFHHRLGCAHQGGEHGLGLLQKRVGAQRVTEQWVQGCS